MVSINRLTLSMEILFKNAVLEDSARFADAFHRNGFTMSYGTPETPVMTKGQFTIRTARTPKVRGRAINVGALSVTPEEIEKFVAHVISVKAILAKELKIDLEQEFKNCWLLANAWIQTGNNSSSVLNRLRDVNDIEELGGFTCHRTPFDKLEFVSKSSQGLLDYDEWHKMEVDSTQSGEYLLSLHYHGNSMPGATEYLRKTASKLISIVTGIEDKVLQGS